jgi:hypothetical protein
MSIKIFFRRKQHEKPEKAAVEVKLKSGKIHGCTV